MQNVFRPVDNGEVLPKRIMQGKPWRNISFSRFASIKDYNDHGLYLEISNKPEISKYQSAEPVGEVIDHTNKTVTIQWEVNDLPPDRIADIDEQDVRKEEKESNALSNITLKQGDNWVETNVTDLASAKLAMKKLLRLILART